MVVSERVDSTVLDNGLLNHWREGIVDPTLDEVPEQAADQRLRLGSGKIEVRQVVQADKLPWVLSVSTASASDILHMLLGGLA